MEIMLKAHTTISESLITFDVASIDFEDDSPCTVSLVNVFNTVSVDVN